MNVKALIDFEAWESRINQRACWERVGASVRAARINGNEAVGKVVNSNRDRSARKIGWRRLRIDKRLS
jgi:hypothetical protein